MPTRRRAFRKAVLFDVDGTLVTAGGAGREALVRGASTALNVPAESARRAAAEIDFRGRTDELLVEELTARLGFDPAGLDARVVSAYLEALPVTLAAAPFVVLPGVRELVRALEARGDIVVGLLTGNIREAARIKLGPAGLAHLADRPGGFGEDGRARADVAKVAVARCEAAGAAPRQVVVIGDTEHDVTAAHAAGARAVAVATGWTEAAVLRACGADLCLPDLADPASIFTLLDAVEEDGSRPPDA